MHIVSLGYEEVQHLHRFASMSPSQQQPISTAPAPAAPAASGVQEAGRRNDRLPTLPSGPQNGPRKRSSRQDRG